MLRCNVLSKHKYFNSRSKGVHVCVDDDEDEGDDEVEDQPDVHHLDVGRLGKTPWDADEESSKDKQGGEIDRHNCLKEEFWMETGIS